MGLPTGLLQAACISRYRGDTTLQGLLVAANSAIAAPTWNIFDAGGVKTGQFFPYLVVQPVTNLKGILMAMGKDANDVLMQVSIFTRYGGFLQARAMADQIDALTDSQRGAAPFVLSGGMTVAGTLRKHYQETLDPDGITQQLVLTYLSWTQG